MAPKGRTGSAHETWTQAQVGRSPAPVLSGNLEGGPRGLWYLPLPAMPLSFPWMPPHAPSHAWLSEQPRGCPQMVLKCGQRVPSSLVPGGP